MEIRKDAFFAALVALGLTAPACGGSSETPADDTVDTTSGDESWSESPTAVDEADYDTGAAPVDEAGYEAEEYAPVTE
ncbi:MAG: hypothetical protein KF901_09915 [Myxococcales bacterium]|nr:hypothetical protein [Myxococcales bacterium]